MRQPDAVDSARVLGFALLGMVAVSLLVVKAGMPKLVGAGLLELSFLAVPLVYARVVGLAPLASSGFRRPSVRPLLLVVVASLGTFWILKALTDVQMEFFRWVGMEQWVAEELDQIRRSLEAARDRGGIPTVLMIVVLPALCEETLFRGIFFRGFVGRFGPAVTLATTSILFSLLHFKVAQGALLFLLGLYFGTVVWLTGNLWAGILAHAINNLGVVILQTRFGARLESFTAPWWMVALSILVTAGAITLMALDRRESPEPSEETRA